MNRSIFQIWQSTVFVWILNFFKNIFNINIVISVIITMFIQVGVAWCEPTTFTIINSLNNFNKLGSGNIEFLATKNITLTRAMHGFNNFIQLWTPQCWNPNLIHFIMPDGRKFPKNHFATHHHFWIFQDSIQNLSWVSQFTHTSYKNDLEFLKFFQKIFDTDLNNNERNQFISSHIRCVDNNEFVVNNSKIILDKSKFELSKETLNQIMVKNNLIPKYFNNFNK